jgi:hypothetical protein
LFFFLLTYLCRAFQLEALNDLLNAANLLKLPGGTTDVQIMLQKVDLVQVVGVFTPYSTEDERDINEGCTYAFQSDVRILTVSTIIQMK